MNGLQIFATFGLPAIAIAGALLALVAARRGAARIDALEKAQRR